MARHAPVLSDPRARAQGAGGGQLRRRAGGGAGGGDGGAGQPGLPLRVRAGRTAIMLASAWRATRPEATVYLEFTAEQRNLQRQLRAYFEELVAEVEGSALDEPTYTRYIRRMGHDGWLGIGWPVEYGGQARGPIDQMIFVEESHWAGVPLPLLTLNSVGPTLMALGTDEQKERILPGILRGEVHFSIGYTEPSAGTDLASLQDAGRARRGRVRDQRPEDLHERHPVRRLRLAGRPDRPGCAQAQGPVGLHRARRHPRVPLDPVGHHRGGHHQLDVLRGRPGPGGEPRRRGEPGLEADHQPAQSRTGGHLPGLGAPAQPRRGAALGAGAPTRGTGAR